MPLRDRPLWVRASRGGFDGSLRGRSEDGDLLLVEPADLYRGL